VTAANQGSTYTDAGPKAALEPIEAQPITAPIEPRIELGAPPELEVSAPDIGDVGVATAEVEPVGTLPRREFSWALLISIIWAGGAVAWMAFATVRIARFQRSLRCAEAAPNVVRSQIDKLAARMGLSRPPGAWLVPGRLAPMLWTLGGPPRLYLPTGLWQRLDTAQQATVLAHELAHLRRHDHWVRSLELITTALYWWHPVVWWACREIREQEEECCDAWVVWSLPDAARAYATALVETVEFLSETGTVLPMAASGIGHVYHLRRRVTMIMRGTTPRALSELGFVAVLGLGALLLPLLPSWAQQPSGTPPPGVQRDSDTAPVDPPPADPNAEPLNARFAPPVDQGDDNARPPSDEVRQIHDEIAALQRQIANAQRRLAQAQKRLADRDYNREQNLAPVPTLPQNARRRAQGDPDQRLAEVERKLDAVLEEMQSLRREMRRGRGGMGGRGMPGMPGMGGGMMPGPAGGRFAPPASGPQQPGQPGGLPGGPGQAPLISPPDSTPAPPREAPKAGAPSTPAATGAADTVAEPPGAPAPALLPTAPAAPPSADLPAGPTPPAPGARPPTPVPAQR
jgi:beta-lactamase regulating signal transducer with metallopeptidase domain